MKSLSEATSALIKQVEPRQREGGIDLIGDPTGFADLDYVLGGYRKSDLYGVAAKSGGGKTAFCVSTLMAIAQQGGHVFYASLEMSAEMMSLRILSGLTGVPALLIEKGKMKDETFRFVKSEAEKLEKMPFYFFDQGLDTPKLNMVLSQMQNDVGLDIAAIDYIALLRDNKGTSAYERATQKADDLKAVAVDFDIPVIVASQLNRASLNREGGRPELQDFKETGQIENNCAVAIFPYILPRDADADNDPDVLDGELIIAKNRHGPSNLSIPVEFLPKQMLWRQKGGDVQPPPLPPRRREG